jgi:hypothetical protein
LYFEIVLALDPYTTAIEDLIDVIRIVGLPAGREGGALFPPGAPLAVAHRVMAERIETGKHSHIAFDFYAHVIDVCKNQRSSSRRHSMLIRAARSWLHHKLDRNVLSLEQYRIAWGPDEIDHIQALAHWQRAIHASSLGLPDRGRIDFESCASIATAAQARRETLGWPTECLAATRAADGAAEPAGDFTKALGEYARSTSLIPFAYKVSR